MNTKLTLPRISMMKNAIKTLAIIPLLVGLGVSTSAAAQDQEILTSIDKAIAAQGQQVTESIAIELKKSYLADIALMAKIAATQWNDKEQVIAKSNLIKTNSPTELNK